MELSRKEIVQGFINTREQQIQSGVSLEAKGVLEAEIEQFKAELIAIDAAEQQQAEQEAAHQVRIQAHEENKEGLLQFIQEIDIFETFFPQEKYAEVMGLSEYIDKRQSFNQVLHQAFVQVEDQRKERHDSDLAERDEKVTALKSTIRQNSEEYDVKIKKAYDLYETGLNEKNKLTEQVQTLTEENSKLKLEQSTLVDEMVIRNDKRLKDEEQIEQLKAENEKLADQLEAFKNQEAPKLTSSLRDLLSQAKIKSAAELAIENAAPFRGKVVIEAVAPPALEAVTFPAYGEATVQLEQANPITIPETVTDEQFRQSVGESQENETVSQENTGDGNISGDAKSVPGATLEEAFRRIEALEKAVFVKTEEEAA